jgi:hypothetical protein
LQLCFLAIEIFEILRIEIFQISFFWLIVIFADQIQKVLCVHPPARRRRPAPAQ